MINEVDWVEIRPQSYNEKVTGLISGTLAYDGWILDLPNKRMHESTFMLKTFVPQITRVELYAMTHVGNTYEYGIIYTVDGFLTVCDNTAHDLRFWAINGLPEDEE